MRPRKYEVPKCDRALQLHEQGVEHSAIAARLGISQAHVHSFIQAGKTRRDAGKPVSASVGRDDRLAKLGAGPNRALHKIVDEDRIGFVNDQNRHAKES